MIDWSLAREAAIWFVKGRQVGRVNIVPSDPGGVSAESWRGGWQESNPAQTLCGRDFVPHLSTAGQAQVDPEVSGE